MSINICRKLLTSTSPRRFFRIVDQYDRGLRFTLGKLHRKELTPGIWFFVPFVQSICIVDTRTKVWLLSQQSMITRDSVKIGIDAIVQSKVISSTDYITNLAPDRQHAITKRSEAELREIISSYTLNEVLEKKDQINSKLSENMRDRIKDWGIHVDSIKINNIVFDDSVVRAMAAKAEAERLAEAKIISAEADVKVSSLFNKASKEMDNENAMTLRQMELINRVATEKNNTIILFPTSALDSLVKQCSVQQAK